MAFANIIRPSKLTTTLPEDVRAKLDLHLFSDLEGRIPKGAYQEFFLARIRDFFDTKTLDISKYTDLPIGEIIVKGSPATIKLLINLLEHKDGY